MLFLSSVWRLLVGRVFVFLGHVIQAEDDLRGLLARGIRGEEEDAIGDAPRDQGGGEPTVLVNLRILGTGELGEDGQVFAVVGDGALFEQPGALAVQADADGKTADRLDDWASDTLA